MFIGAMDEDGVAFKSGKFHCNDRILACNGVDFTQMDTPEPIKDIFNKMAQKPVLRIAIGRGVGIPMATDNERNKEEIKENGRNLKIHGTGNQHNNNINHIPVLLLWSLSK